MREEITKVMVSLENKNMRRLRKLLPNIMAEKK